MAEKRDLTQTGKACYHNFSGFLLGFGNHEDEHASCDAGLQPRLLTRRENEVLSSPSDREQAEIWI